MGEMLPNCVFLAVFLFLRQMDLVHTAPYIDCDTFKFKVQHQYQRRYCMLCQICPPGVESKLLNADCKRKIPNSVPGQGYAWCTGTNDKAPWCPQLTVQHGRLKCTKGNDVYSTCTLQCDFGYKPENISWAEPKCLDSLHWSIPDQSVLRCQRSEKPDKPTVTSFGQRQEVRAGSEKTLQCIPSSVTVGKLKTYWYFQDKQLFRDSDSEIYVIRGASKYNDGEYFCQVEDDIGKSELSAGYYLKVEEIHTINQFNVELISGILLVTCGLIILGFLYWKRSKMYTCGLGIWQSITKCQHHKESDTLDSCLSSVASSVGGSSQTSGTTGTTDCGSSDGESKLPLMAEKDEKTQLSQFIDVADKPQLLESKPLLTEQEIASRENTVSLLHLTSALKDAVKDPALKDAVNDQALKDQMIGTLHTSSTRNDKTIEMERNNITGINNQDQLDLRLVFKDHKLMKRMIILLDQKPEVNKDKPTFHSLGRYLGDSPDEVYHFEFCCQYKTLSPTEGYIKRMTEEGQGLSSLLTFLKQHKETLELAEEIEKTVLHLYHPLVD